MFWFQERTRKVLAYIVVGAHNEGVSKGRARSQPCRTRVGTHDQVCVSRSVWCESLKRVDTRTQAHVCALKHAECVRDRALPKF